MKLSSFCAAEKGNQRQSGKASYKCGVPGPQLKEAGDPVTINNEIHQKTSEWIVTMIWATSQSGMTRKI